ncbi:MAG: hypothetical protein KDD39_05090 [Bdellovibrionales bacterium]|nr:hypothetical protein [Bdellovibrionales bacterium]
MMILNKPLPPEDLKATELRVSLPAHVVRDLETMAANTKQDISKLVEISLKMFIATHNDFLRRNKVP